MPPPSFPFELVSSRTWVRAKLDGKGAFGILDTGADGTAVDVVFASKLGLVGGTAEKATVEADELELPRSGPATFELGDVRLQAKTVYLAPLAQGLTGLDFILGMDALSEVAFTVDYAAKRVELGLSHHNVLPFASPSDSRPTVLISILGEEFTGVIDTGSSGGLSLPINWVRERSSDLGFAPTTSGTRTILGKGELQFQKFTIPKIILGGEEITVVPAEGVSAEKGTASEQKTRWTSVGNLILQRLGSVGVDPGAKVVSFGNLID